MSRKLLLTAALATVAIGGFAGPARAATLGELKEFPLAEGRAPTGIAVGPDGNLWFTERAANRIGRITPAGVVTEFPVPTANAGPRYIAAGSDGALWFTESAAHKIGRITTGGTITEYRLPPILTSQGPLPNRGAPFGITRGPDGNMWFTELNGNKVARVIVGGPRNGQITEFPVPTAGAAPARITTAANGRMWFAEQNANKLGSIRLDGTNVIIGERTLQVQNSRPFGVASATDGAVWLTQEIGSIARVGATQTTFGFPGAQPKPQGVVQGKDGAMWSALEGSDQIARTLEDGTTTTQTGGTGDTAPHDLVVGPDDALWFTQLNGDRIARLGPAAPQSEAPAEAPTEEPPMEEAPAELPPAEGEFGEFAELAGPVDGEQAADGAQPSRGRPLVGLRTTRRCQGARTLRVRLNAVPGSRILGARLVVRGNVRATVRARPGRTAVVKLRRLPRKAFVLRVAVRTTQGSANVTRRFGGCARR